MCYIKLIDKILSVAKNLFSLREEFQKARRAKRDRIARLFEDISKCIAGVSTELKEEIYPTGKCAEMYTYATTLKDIIKDEIGEEKAEELTNDLIEAHEVELLLGKLHNAPDRDIQLAKLDEASGIFLALSNITRAS